MAQTLARHSDIRLTLGVYTHVGLHAQTAAIQSLPAPPDAGVGPQNDAAVLRATGTDGGEIRAAPDENSLAEVPSGAENGAVVPASRTLRLAPDCTGDDEQPGKKGDAKSALTRGRTKGFAPSRNGLHRVASTGKPVEGKYPRLDSNQ